MEIPKFIPDYVELVFALSLTYSLSIACVLLRLEFCDPGGWRFYNSSGISNFAPNETLSIFSQEGVIKLAKDGKSNMNMKGLRLIKKKRASSHYSQPNNISSKKSDFAKSVASMSMINA